MDAALEPADYTVTELDDALEDVDEPDQLRAMLDAESTGKDRKTAKEAIEERLEAISGKADNGDGAADDPAADGDDDNEPTDQAAADSDAPAPTAAETDETAEAVADVDAAATALGLTHPGEDEVTDQGPEPDVSVDKRLLTNIVRIRRTLEDVTGQGGSFEARIRQLQAEVSDLKSYTNALEEFLEAEGTGQQVIESVTRDLDAISEDVEDLEITRNRHGRILEEHGDSLAALEADLTEQADRLEAQDDDLDAVADDLDAMANSLQAHEQSAAERHGEQSARIDGVEDRLANHDADLESLADDLDDVRGAADAVTDDLEALETEITDRLDREADHRSTLAARVDDLAETSEALSTSLDEVADDVAALERTVGDADRIDERLAAIEEDLKTLKHWRDQLGTAMMGGEKASPGSDEA